MTRFVVDCSITASWCLDDEADAYADAVLGSLAACEALVPALWPYEMANVLLVAERRRRITADATARFLRHLAQLPVVIAADSVEQVLNAALALGRTHGLTAYDAAYVALARSEDIPLATLDASLMKAARKAGVKRFEP